MDYGDVHRHLHRHTHTRCMFIARCMFRIRGT